MNRYFTRALIRLYPGGWRQRYGEEFEAMLEDQPSSFRVLSNVLSAGLAQRLEYQTKRLVLATNARDSIEPLARIPTAIVPMFLSIAALGVVYVALVMAHGATVPERDEGAEAHLWQLCMAGQVPLVAYFALRWIPQLPRKALIVLVLQLLLALTAMAPVYLLGL